MVLDTYFSILKSYYEAVSLYLNVFTFIVVLFAVMIIRWHSCVQPVFFKDKFILSYKFIQVT